MKYDVAISFAGEQRTEARAIANCITNAGLNVFFDEYEDATLWGMDLYEHLSDVYQNQARYCIILVSKAYADKVWTNHERRNAQARALREKQSYILPVRFDNTDLPGLAPTIAYLNFSQYEAEGICNAFLRKVGHAGTTRQTSQIYSCDNSPFASIKVPGTNTWLFVPVVNSRWSIQEVSLSVEPDEPTDGTTLDGLQINSDVYAGYGNNVALCRITDRTHITQAGRSQWDLKLKVEKTDFIPSFEINFGNTSSDDLAEKRARRILLNENPSEETRDINKMLIENYTAGDGTPISIKKSIFPDLFQQYGNNPKRFLGITWVCAVMLLKLSGAVAEVLHLKFSLKGNSLEIDFSGKRKKEYVNRPAYEIRVNGVCDLRLS